MLRMRSRNSVGFVEPCLPSPAERPPAGANWIYEIKHDGIRILARRDGAGVCLITRHGNDFTSRFPLAVAAVTALPAHSFLLDGEAIVTNERGLVVFYRAAMKREGLQSNCALTGVSKKDMMLPVQRPPAKLI